MDELIDIDTNLSSSALDYRVTRVVVIYSR